MNDYNKCEVYEYEYMNFEYDEMTGYVIFADNGKACYTFEDFCETNKNNVTVGRLRIREKI